MKGIFMYAEAKQCYEDSKINEPTGSWECSWGVGDRKLLTEVWLQGI